MTRPAKMETPDHSRGVPCPSSVLDEEPPPGDAPTWWAESDGIHDEAKDIDSEYAATAAEPGDADVPALPMTEEEW